MAEDMDQIFSGASLKKLLDLGSSFEDLARAVECLMFPKPVHLVFWFKKTEEKPKVEALLLDGAAIVT